ncbi:MAG: glycogen/starch synthase, partial [bacterium]|nr:glycogen/starch synthase [bacterium]
MPKNKIKIIMAAAELAPLVKVGGLGDVTGSLPRALAKLGLDLAIFLPFYGSIDRKKYKAKLLKDFLSIDISSKQEKFAVYLSHLPESNIKIFLISHPLFSGKDIYVAGSRYFKKGNYSSSKGVYSREISDIERFVFFSKAVVESIRVLKLRPDLIHCHDWHTALIPTFIDEYSLEHADFKNIKTIYTIHNLANQGIAGLDILDYASLSHDLTPAIMEDYYDVDGQVMDLMKVGILSADYVSTVSPTYSREILSKEYGAGLEKYLNRRKKHLVGILNGIDTDFFNPQKDKYIKKKYSLANVFSVKKINKENLQRISRLPLGNQPLFGLVSRLVPQKGLDILLLVIEKLIEKYDLQLIILGTGKKDIEVSWQNLAKKYPRNIKTNIGFDVALAQKIYAGADFFLMPSAFEPCGLGQMISMRYGTIPIVRQTGGLKDTVKNKKNGFVFKNYDKESLAKTMLEAIKFYQQKSQF